MAHSLGLPQAARKSQQPLSPSISNILNTWSLSTIEIWPCCENSGIFFGFLKLQARGAEGLCQPNSASDLKLLEKLISRTELPSEGRSALHASFLLISLLHDLVLPFICAKRWFHSLSPTLRVPGAQLNERGRTVGMTSLPWCLHRQSTATSSCPLFPQMPTEAFNLPFSSQHCHFSDFKRIWSVQEFQFPAFKVLQSWRNLVFPSGGPSLEPETCFTEVRQELQSSPQPAVQHCSTPCSLWFLPARTTCPAHPHLWYVIWLGNSGTEWLELFHEWK